MTEDHYPAGARAVMRATTPGTNRERADVPRNGTDTDPRPPHRTWWRTLQLLLRALLESGTK